MSKSIDAMDNIQLENKSENSDNVIKEVFQSEEKESENSDNVSQEVVQVEENKYENSDNFINKGEEVSSNIEFNRKNIESFGKKISIVDTDTKNNLSMFCYLKCDEKENDLIKNCRGVVFNGENIVMKAFPYTPEYVNSDIGKITDTITDFSEWNFFQAHEGTLLRVFCFNDSWFISTHRKLDAFRSKWSSRTSFGESFKNSLLVLEQYDEKFRNSLPDERVDILERFLSTLDKSKQYMFLVRNTSDNRIVCKSPEKQTMYHVGTFVNNKLCFDQDVNIPYPKKVDINNIDELLDYVKNISCSEMQGVIGMTSNNQHIKILNDEYRELFCARGNEPSIKFRYLQVRCKDLNIVNMLYYLYPDIAKTFDEYENILYDIAKFIYKAYVDRFIKKQYITVPTEEFSIIRECHSWHLQDRRINRISLDKVIHVMNTQTPTNLNHMIRRFKMGQHNNNNNINITINNRSRINSSSSVKSFDESPCINRIVTDTSNITPLSI